MLVSQAFLALCCVFLGLLAPVALNIIEPICTAALQNPVNISTFYTIPMAPFACIMASMVVIIYGLWLTASEKGIRSYITWDCGFGGMTKRMQGTATSFAENIGKTFAPLLEYDAHTIIVGRDRRHFPETIQEETRMTPILEAHVYRPVVKVFQWSGERMMHLQAGTIHLYLGYILLTLVALLVIGILI